MVDNTTKTGGINPFGNPSPNQDVDYQVCIFPDCFEYDMTLSYGVYPTLALLSHENCTASEIRAWMNNHINMKQ